MVSASRNAQLPITVRGPDDVDLKIPRWMTDPAAGRLEIAAVAVLPLDVLRAVAERLAPAEQLPATRALTDPGCRRQRRERRRPVEDMRQREFPWAAPGVRRDAPEVVLDPATTTAAIGLLDGARALRRNARRAG